MTQTQVELATSCVDTCLGGITVGECFQNGISVLYLERAKCWFQLTHISYCLSLASAPTGAEGSQTIFRAQ